MPRLTTLFVITTLFSALAYAASSSGKGGFSKFALTYGETPVVRDMTTNVTQLQYLRSYSLEAEAGYYPVAIHLSTRETMSQKVRAIFSTTTPFMEDSAELYFTMWEFGLKMILPLNPFQFWIGAGYLFGTVSLNRPRYIDDHNWLVIYGRELKSTWGSYYHGGLDLMLSNSFGLRGYYQVDDVRTDRFSDINRESLSSTQERWMAGLVFTID